MPGKIKIATEGNKVKRDLDVNTISSIENSTEKAGGDAERGVTFSFLERGKEERRSIMFVSKRQRDQFVDEIEKLNPKLVRRKKDGTLTGREEQASKEKDDKKNAAQLARAALGGGGVDDGGSDRFFAMEENDFGFQEPRMLTFSDTGADLRLFDATAGGQGHAELPLRRLKAVAQHALDKSVLSLAFHDGGVLRHVNRTVVLTFGSRPQRERFQRELLATLAGHDAAAAKLVEVDDKWRSALPTKFFVRFEASMTKPKKAAVALLVSARRRCVYVIRTGAIANYEPGCIISARTPVLEILTVAPFRTQLQRSSRSDRAVAIGDAGANAAFDVRELTEFEFASNGERERFCAYVAICASPDDAAQLRDASARAGSGAGALAALPPLPVRAPAGNVRATFRPPSSADTSWLWGAQWPHDDVKVWCGSYNVSATPPPESLEPWVPVPARDSERGARDLYVFGLQELGPAANREAWGRALLAHLNLKSLVSRGPFGGFAAEADVTYKLVNHVFMWEMGLWVFARSAHVPDITSVSHADVPTGVAVAKAITGVQLGNKGGVGIGLRWRETPLAFVMCHLAARPDAARMRQREADYRAIVRRLRLDTAGAGVPEVDFVHAHDHVFYFGDVNYRIDLPFDRVVTLYKGKQWGAIMAHDQMVREMARQKVFVGFSEPLIEFAPTYRWEREREEFSWKRGQAPSYTDRILSRSLPGVAAKLESQHYDSATFMWGSDHRAVGAGYTLALRRYYAAPSPPTSYVPYWLPTFFSALDAPRFPVPVVLLSALRVFSMQALAAPAALTLTLHAPWLEDSVPILLGKVVATGVSEQQKQQLRALKLELGELAKTEAKRRKEEAARAKVEAKAAKAKGGDKEGPRVTIGGDPAYRAASKAAGGAAVAPLAPRADEDDEAEDDGAADHAAAAASYAALDEDSGYAASAAQSMSLLETSAAADPRKRELLELQAEFAWLPADACAPPLRPVCWDPRLLRDAHVTILAHAQPDAEGSFLAIGGGAKAKASKDKSGLVPNDDKNLVGQASVPLLALVRGAQAALEMALRLDAELEGGEAAAGGGGAGGRCSWLCEAP